MDRKIRIEEEKGVWPSVLRGSKKKNRLVSNGSVKEHFQDYCASTSIHGVKYLGEEDRPLVERLWWVFVFVVSFAGSAYLMWKVWNKWNNSPVIVSFAETSTPVWGIPFPAVTICSETKSRQTAFNFTEALWNHSKNITDEETAKQLRDIALVCDQHVFQEGAPTTDDSTINFLIKVAPQFDEMMWHCKWKMGQENCSRLFTPMLTEEGVCFSFNMLDAFELYRGNSAHEMMNHGRPSLGWTLENGYKDTEPLDTYPHRARGAGARAGLTILLRANTNDLDYYCRGPVQGFKILLHNPAEIPRVSEQYFRAPLNQEVVVAIKPAMMTTSEALRPYSARRRQCYFPSERYLAFFKVYTQKNCQLECLTNFTLHKCGCVGFYMPRQKGTPVCSSGRKSCMYDAADTLVEDEIRTDLENKNEEVSDGKDIKCDCLQACTDLQYDAETSQADFNWRRVIVAYKENDTDSDIYGMNLARVSIFFKEAQFITSRRSELYGLVEFLANCGGLLGLFSGFSILSLVEIVYYVTLRLWSNLRKKRIASLAKRRVSDVKPVPVFN